MAEIVAYRVEKTLDELKLLVDFGLFSEDNAKEIIAKRENFEYALRRRNKSKLDFLKYIKYEMNLLESIDKYRKTVLKECNRQSKKGDKIDELNRKIVLLQAKKLNDIIRSRSAHVSSLFRKLTINFQFDKKLWLAYIEFAKSRNWNTRVTALYWRVLRVSSNDPDLWLAAAAHEIDVNKAFDTARGLYLRALRHHPKLSAVWIEYFKMELKFMDVVDQRARIIFKITNQEEKKDEDIWAEKETDRVNEMDDDDAEISDEDDENDKEAKDDQLPEVKPIDEDDTIISGHLPKIVYKSAAEALDSRDEFLNFLVQAIIYVLCSKQESKGLSSVKEYINADIRQRLDNDDLRISKELVDNCNNLNYLKGFIAKSSENSNGSKRLKKAQPSNMETLYECYETKGLDEARKLFKELEKSVKNRTLSLFVGMIQVESWQLAKDSSEEQLNRIRAIYDKALLKFGQTKPKLWYEYLQFEHNHAKSLSDFERINQVYMRAQATLHKSKVDRVIEKYTLLQINSSSADIEYSDYSDLED